MNFAVRQTIRVSSKVRVSTCTPSFSKVPTSFASNTTKSNVSSTSSTSSNPIASFSSKTSSIINNPKINNTKSVLSMEFLISSDDDGV